jgi:leucyl/phenylalanyl-tRNA--protein transferase
LKHQLEITTLLSAYCQGIFPMSNESGEINWFCPNPRAIIPISTYKPSKSLRPIINRKVFDIRINQQFEQVMRFCAQPRKDEDGIWISEELINAFTQLHKIGFAHSVEAYQNNELVGGLYGVCIGGVFYGESMFSLVSNASKVAFYYLIKILQENELVKCLAKCFIIFLNRLAMAQNAIYLYKPPAIMSTIRLKPFLNVLQKPNFVSFSYKN